MADKSKRGFGSMDINKRREIASKGGKAAHAKGSAHRFTPEEAREAGRKGGQAAHQKGTAHEFTPEEASFAGRKGGKAAGHREPEHGFATQEGGLAESRPEPVQPATHEAPAISGSEGFRNWCFVLEILVRLAAVRRTAVPRTAAHTGR